MEETPTMESIGRLASRAVYEWRLAEREGRFDRRGLRSAMDALSNAVRAAKESDG